MFEFVLENGLHVRWQGQRVGGVSQGIAANDAGEAVAKALSQRFAVDPAALDKHKASAIVAMTASLIEGADAEALRFIDTELRKAVVAAEDSIFLGALRSASPSAVVEVASTSGGSPADAEDIRTDLLGLLDVVNVAGAGMLVWAFNPRAANRLSLFQATISNGDGRMTPTGGVMLGLPAIVSDQVAAGDAWLFEAGGVAVAAEDLQVETARHASIQLADDAGGDAGTPTPTTLTNLWQTNSRALRAERRFAFAIARPNSVARLDGASWA
jgi:hypothetical protein